MVKNGSRFLVLLVLTWTYSVAPAEAAEVHLVQASNGLVRSFEERIKAKEYGPFVLTWWVEGSFAKESDPVIECHVRISDGQTSEGFSRPRRGVRVLVGAEVHALDGRVLATLGRARGKTDKNGRVTLRLPAPALANSYVTVAGTLKRKRLTSGSVTCIARDGRDDPQPLPLLASRDARPAGTVELLQFARSAKAASRARKTKKWDSLELDFVATLESDSILDCISRISSPNLKRSLNLPPRGLDYEVQTIDPVTGERGVEFVGTADYDLSGIAVFVIDNFGLAGPPTSDGSFRLKTHAEVTGSGKLEEADLRCTVK